MRLVLPSSQVVPPKLPEEDTAGRDQAAQVRTVKEPRETSEKR